MGETGETQAAPVGRGPIILLAAKTMLTDWRSGLAASNTEGKETVLENGGAPFLLKHELS